MNEISYAYSMIYHEHDRKIFILISWQKVNIFMCYMKPHDEKFKILTLIMRAGVL